MRKSHLSFTILFVVLASLSSVVAWGQAAGTISGKVISPSGAAVPEAAVSITNTGTGASQRVLTGPDGGFLVSGLAPGTYKVAVENPGFTTAVRENIQLAADSPVTLELVLEAGAPGQTKVEAQSSTSAVQDSSGQKSQLFGERQITDTPIIDRNRQQLQELVTGVTPPEAMLAPALDPQRNRQYSVNGQQALGVLQSRKLDGSQNIETYLGISDHIPTNEAIQTFNVVTSNPRAMYGITAGSSEPVFNRTGTNEIHGDVFEFNSFSWLRARPVFDNSPNPAPTYAFNQFGGSVGGPIVKNRIFFFGAYEGDIQRGQNTLITTVPTAAFRSGDFSGVPGLTLFNPATGTSSGAGRFPFVGNLIPASAISPMASALLPFIPLPNRPGTEDNFMRNVPFHNDGNRADGRVDFRASDHTSFFARYAFSRFFALDESPLGSLIGNTQEGNMHAHNGALNLTHVFSPGVTTEGRFSMYRYDDKLYGPSLNSPLAATIGVSNLPSSALPSILISGMAPIGTKLGYPTFISSMNGLPVIGPTAGFPGTSVNNDFEWTSNWNITRGRHNVNWGVDVWHIRSDGFRNPLFSPAGEFDFGAGATGVPGVALAASGLFPSAFAAFLAGAPTQVGVQSFAVTPSYRTTYYSGFVNDVVRVGGRLTLDLGLRYDIFSPLSTRRAGDAAIYNPADNTLRLVGVDGVSDRGNVKYDFDNVAPRFGFALKLTDKTVVRGGYGITYFPAATMFAGGYLNPIAFTAQAGAPGSFAVAGGVISLPAPAAPSSATAGLIAAPPNQTFVFGPPHPETPYVQSYSVSVQQDFGANTLLDIAYIGSLGRELPFSREINFVGPGATDFPLAAFGRTASTIERGYGLNNNYNSLQVNLRKQFQHYISFIGSYTYSKALDYSSNPFVPIIGATARNYGPADYDRTHIFSLSHVIQIPIGAGSGRLNSGRIGEALGGWQLNGIFRWATGTPFSVLADPAACGCPGLPYAYANAVQPISSNAEAGFNPAAFAAPSGSIGNTGRNILRGPGFKTYDLSLFRSFSLRERAKFELRGEAYNLFNTPLFANPVNVVGSANLGLVTHTLSPNMINSNNREFHLAAKIIF
ncbi:MAG TPA: TonB-dependent receptor [Bryobacterales bacterium]|nr:TonB-dependent receptor [Bryobacterales bacterium]